MSADLTSLCRYYFQLLLDSYHIRSDWFFPGRKPSNMLTVATLDQKFNAIWKMTIYSSSEHKPTVHSLRHSFVVKRMNLWMENGVDLRSRMPYLSKYLGHTSVDDTFYYYHQVDSAFKLIKEKDTSSAVIIPEVGRYE